MRKGAKKFNPGHDPRRSLKPCGCGCGAMVMGRWKRGHYAREFTTQVNRGTPKLCKCGCGGQPVFDPSVHRRTPLYLTGHRSSPKRLADQAYVDSLKAAPCTDCGRTFPPECMDFDHMPGHVKLGPINTFYFDRVKLDAEIAKCELVCACCHRSRTRKRRQYRPRKPKVVTA